PPRRRAGAPRDLERTALAAPARAQGRGSGPLARHPTASLGGQLEGLPQTPSSIRRAAGSSLSQTATGGRRPPERPQASARRLSAPQRQPPPDRGCRADARRPQPPEDERTRPGTGPLPRGPNRPPYPLLPQGSKTVTHIRRA